MWIYLIIHAIHDNLIHGLSLPSCMYIQNMYHVILGCFCNNIQPYQEAIWDKISVYLMRIFYYKGWSGLTRELLKPNRKPRQVYGQDHLPCQPFNYCKCLEVQSVIGQLCGSWCFGAKASGHQHIEILGQYIFYCTNKFHNCLVLRCWDVNLIFKKKMTQSF